ncbi:LysE family translocator [Rahnella sp. BCC 1045]|jgi:threonine/homoserine/homoserine lactone efflux protein|uniref:LysE family translocator n=1 Tax=Rahnella TaxID=34037 RepID=UPI001C25C36D|nr:MULTISPECIES: LysE family translocator [Rahnella]MBU9818968.1 LysE family translocator [Rahnella sp. BCC 1045]MDF1892654.1 LysE family translocator [Rahnella contaminans]
MDINLSGFIPALLPIALSPGASFTLAMNSALSGGQRGLLKTLTGTALGIYTHAILIGLGITSLLVASPALFHILKIAGTAYLLWLGIQLIRSGLKAREMVFDSGGAPVTMKDAWLANVLNPKAIMFYLTVVSQFAGSKGEIGHYMILATVHIAVMTLWLIAISKVLIFSANKMNTMTLKKYVNVAGGGLLILFAFMSILH